MRFHARTHDDDGDGRQRASGWISLFRFGGFPHIFLIECGWMDGRYWFFSVPHLSCYPESGSSATNPHMRGELDRSSFDHLRSIRGELGEHVGFCVCLNWWMCVMWFCSTDNKINSNKDRFGRKGWFWCWNDDRGRRRDSVWDGLKKDAFVLIWWKI